MITLDVRPHYRHGALCLPQCAVVGDNTMVKQVPAPQQFSRVAG